MIQFWRALRGWWREQAREKGAARAISLLVGNLWSCVRESMPERRRQRYGDMEYDWEHRVNTASGAVGWRARLLGLFHSPYQPTDPALFQEIMASLPIEFEQFAFVDLGSGKGRTLLMASEYPFKRIVGVELIAELHRGGGEYSRLSEPDAALRADRDHARRRARFRISKRSARALPFQPAAGARSVRSSAGARVVAGTSPTPGVDRLSQSFAGNFPRRVGFSGKSGRNIAIFGVPDDE